MAKSSNRWRKRIFTLGMLAMVLLPIGYFGGKYVLKQRTAGWKRDGLAAARTGDHERAADLLYRYLRRIPRDEEALKAYASSREQAELPNGQHLAASIEALKLLVGMDPQRLGDHLHLLELYVRTDRRPEAIDIANAILKQQPGNTAALRLKSEMLLRQGQYREVLETTGRWIVIAPRDVSAHLDRMEAQSQLGYPPAEMLNEALRLIQANSNDAHFELIGAVAHRLAGNRQDAARLLRSAAGRPVLEEELIPVLVTQFDLLGMSDDALTLLDDLVKRGAGKEVRATLARRFWESGKWERCAAMLADLDPQSAQSDSTLLALRAIAAARTGNAADGAACRSALAGRKQAAARAWVRLLSRILDASAVDDRQLVKDCRDALILDPRNSYLADFLGEAYARQGERDLAISAWQHAIRINPFWPVPATRLVEMYLQTGQTEEAMRLAIATVQRCPNHSMAVISLAVAWSAGIERGRVGHREELLKLVTSLQNELPNEDQSLLITLQLHARAGEKQKAQQIIRDALQRPKASERLLLSMAIASRNMELGLEEPCLRACEEHHGVTPLSAYVSAVDKLTRGNGDDGLKVFDEKAAASGKPSDLAWRRARTRYLDLLGGEKARVAWIALADAYPNEASIQQEAVSTRTLASDWDFQTRAIERLRRLTGDNGLAWRLARARLEVLWPRSIKDVESGSVLLTQIVKEFPDAAEPRVLLARALKQMGRDDAAVEHLARAAQLEPLSVPIGLLHAAALQSRGLRDRAQREIARITPLLRTVPEQQAAAQVLSDAGDLAGAEALLTRDTLSAAAPPTLLLAHVCVRQEKWTQAESVFTRLLEKPDLPILLHAAAFYDSRGRSADADKAIARIDTLQLEPGRAAMVRGEHYSRIGDNARAIQEFTAATRQAPADPAAWGLLLRKQFVVGGIDAALATADEAAAKATVKAPFEAIRERAPLLREASRVISLQRSVASFLSDPLNSATTIEMMRLVVDGNRTGDLERLAVRLQQFADAHPAYPPALIQLALCHQSMGRNAAALSTARRAAANFRNSTELAQLIMALCGDGGHWEEMLAAAEELKKLPGGDSLAADLAIARAQTALGRWASVVKLLEQRLPAARANPDRHVEVLSLYALSVANTGQEKAASDILWPLAQSRAPWRVQWIEISLSLANRASAVSWLEQVAAIIIAQGAVSECTLLADAYDSLSRRLNDPQLARKAKDLAAKNAAAPDATAATLLAAAMLADRQGDSSTAESLYRRAIEKDADLWIAKNNLAMLLLNRNADPAQAIALATDAVRAQGQVASLSDTLAFAQARSGDPAAAAQTLRSAIALQPDNPVWRIRQAQYLVDAANIPEAGKVLVALDDARINTRNLPEDLQAQLEQLRKTVKGRK